MQTEVHNPANTILFLPILLTRSVMRPSDRKSTRLNSSHDQISYAVFCLKKKKKKRHRRLRRHLDDNDLSANEKTFHLQLYPYAVDSHLRMVNRASLIVHTRYRRDVAARR